jgi:thioester reductase-like protein
VGTFLTGSTGYIGAHVVANLLRTTDEPLLLLVRADNPQEGGERLWQSLQLHMDFREFEDCLRSRIRVLCGDLTDERFGFSPADYDSLVHSTNSIIHCAASLNRKSEKACLNVNLRGTLQVIQLGMGARDHHGLRRFSHVSTVAVAGKRSHEVVQEDQSIEWDRSDYDPYARTKKFCEYMLGEMLPDVPRTIFRPSIVLGDSRRAETNQFDMVRAFVFLAGLPFLPFRPGDRIDIVPVDYVADAIVALHGKDPPLREIYHLSSGTGSETFREITTALAAASNKRGPVFVPEIESASMSATNWLANRQGKIGSFATLLKVFLPYLVWDTVFDNSRVAAEMGRAPVSFSEYCYPLLKFSRESHFHYPYQPWPADGAPMEASVIPAAARQHPGA